MSQATHPTDNDVLQTAARLNSEALKHLLLKDKPEATRCFHDALTALNERLEFVATEDEDTEATPPASSLPSVLCWTPLTISGFQDDSLYVHDQALLFSAPIGSLNPQEDWQAASVMLLFNLALCYHHSGIESSDTRKLEQAFRLYSLCTTYMEDFDYDSPLFALFYFCKNNQAHIRYSGYSNYQEAAEILESVPLDGLRAAAEKSASLADSLQKGVLPNIVAYLSGIIMGAPAA